MPMSVQGMQRLLNLLPSSFPRLATDGQFGQKTKARLIEFQYANGLPATGIADEATLQKLSWLAWAQGSTNPNSTTRNAHTTNANARAAPEKVKGAASNSNNSADNYGGPSPLSQKYLIYGAVALLVVVAITAGRR